MLLRVEALAWLDPTNLHGLFLQLITTELVDLARLAARAARLPWRLQLARGSGAIVRGKPAVVVAER